MTQFFNGTPHAINIVDKATVTFNASIRKYVSAEPVIVLSIPSNGMLSAKVKTVETAPMDGVPVFIKVFEGVDELPDAGVIIVSAMYASAARATGASTQRLYTVADPVYTTDGKTIVGSLGICLFI